MAAATESGDDRAVHVDHLAARVDPRTRLQQEQAKATARSDATGNANSEGENFRLNVRTFHSTVIGSWPKSQESCFGFGG
jgi:hypothetical protein